MIGFRTSFASARWTVLAAAMSLVGCGPSAAPPLQLTRPPEDAGFLPSPRVLTAVRTDDGGTLLTGTGPPGAAIRLASPGGSVLTAEADKSGGWRVAAPPHSEVTLYGLSAGVGDRNVQAEGYVAMTPPPGDPAAVLRAGGGSVQLGEARKRSLTLSALDLDAAGAAIVSGRAPARQPVTAAVDQAEAGQGAASATGAYTLTLSAALAQGRHRIAVSTGGRRANVDLAVTAPKAPDAGPWRSERLENAWRVDWVTPGGGLQTAYLLDPGAAR
jgi:hypothetical protein